MAKLLQGSAELLQPTNILKNSNFSILEGRSSVQSLGSIVALSGTTSVAISKNWELNIFRCNVSNLVVTISNGSCRIQCDCVAGTGNPQVRLIQSVTAPIGVVHTGTCKVSFNQENSISGVLRFGGSSFNADVYYSSSINHSSTTSSKSESGEIVQIFRENDGSFGLSPALYVTRGTSGHVDITFGNVCLYEGAYINVPSYKSLDISLRNEFFSVKKDNEYRQSFLGKAMAANNWYKVFKFPCTSSDDVYMDFFMYKGWSGEYKQKYRVKISLDIGTSLVVASQDPLMQFNYLHSSNDSSARIDKIALAYEADMKNLFLMFHCRYALSANAWVYMPSYCTYGNSGEPFYFWAYYCFDGSASNNLTILKECSCVREIA